VRNLALALAGVLAATALSALAAAPAGASSPTPAAPAVSAIATGDYHTIALTRAGTVWAWGANEHGQLGRGSTSSTGGPAHVKSPSGTGLLRHVVAVAAAGLYSAALRVDGTIVAWGDDGVGELGDGTTGPPRPLPTPVKSPDGSGTLTHVVQIAAGDNHMLAVTADGRVWAWGDNQDGQLGDNSWGSPSPVPVPVAGASGAPAPLSGVVAVSAGHLSSLAVAADGSVYTWGDNTGNELGDGGTDLFEAGPVPVAAVAGQSGALTHVVAASMGDYDTIALRSDGTVVAWGGNADGQLGVGDEKPTKVPEPVPLPAPVVAVNAGSYAGYAVTRGGAVFGWGENTFGGLGDGQRTQSDSPIPLYGLGCGPRTLGVASDVFFAAAVRADGTVWSWGDDSDDQLGDGSGLAASAPVPVPGVRDVGLPALLARHDPVVTRYGSKLVASKGVWGPAPTSVAFQWRRGGHPIHGATHRTYHVTPADRGHKISVRVTAHRPGYPDGHATSVPFTPAS
jgi:alpha-tubulin suppressor-like RCC1 family protein